VRESDFQLPWQDWIADLGPRFLLFSRQQTRCESDAADVLQDSLIELWCRTGGSPPEPALVFATIRRRAIDLARKNESRNAREKQWAVEAATLGPETRWFDSDTSQEERKIAAALRAIRPGFAEVVVLKIWGELTFDQIATTLSINPSTAASRYRYGVEALRLHLNTTPVP
jgi:RNA polymerase sigma-70 factor (ECF subfamily)